MSFTQHWLQVNGYRWIDGMEFLLLDLARQGVEMHIFSNYPSWYKRIEAKLAVTRFLPWTFVSCEGPIKVRAHIPYYPHQCSAFMQHLHTSL